jgi:hypothetical protein
MISLFQNLCAACFLATEKTELEFGMHRFEDQVPSLLSEPPDELSHRIVDLIGSWNNENFQSKLSSNLVFESVLTFHIGIPLPH